MTGKDRVQGAIQRKTIDRFPAGMMGIDDSVATGVRSVLGLPAKANPKVFLGIDFFQIDSVYTGPEFAWKPEETRNSFFGSSKKTYTDIGIVNRPLRDATTISEVEKFGWPQTGKDFDFSNIPELLTHAGDRAVITNAWTPAFSQLCELFGIESALYNLAIAQELMEAGANRIADLVIDLTQNMHGAAGGNLLIFATADDVATQRGLMFSPDTWRKIFKPSLARQFAAAKKLGLITWMHSCGDVSTILPDLVEIGLDVLEPTQAHLPGMQPDWLKREFGRDLTFFGGISTQTTLPFGNSDDVRREVRERIRVLGSDGGGYIVSPDHHILEGVPPENVIALYDEVGSLVL